jgi:hypothetical protein
MFKTLTAQSLIDIDSEPTCREAGQTWKQQEKLVLFEHVPFSLSHVEAARKSLKIGIISIAREHEILNPWTYLGRSNSASFVPKCSGMNDSAGIFLG